MQRQLKSEQYGADIFYKDNQDCPVWGTRRGCFPTLSFKAVEGCGSATSGVERMVAALITKLTEGPTLVRPGPHSLEGEPLTLSANDTPIDKAPLSEKRREPRYPCNDPVKVRVISINAEPVAATVLDVSRSGLRLELSTPIAKGTEIEVTARGQVVIFGEVRYCRRSGDCFHAGILIRDVVHSRPYAVKHLHDDDLSLYLVGKGLKMPEVIRVRDHLAICETCQLRLSAADAILHPIRKRKFF